ncbi:hypothetical protein TIFTF001_010895 [Ficus carica]|uniref:Trichome birefringence-like N-terminal domain-containing protein n=1 Tax=Ficus carica TaxID=3494 RepID=A0AA87ZXR0_FICCA|nr:hypothetical protein TIFTF001_010895 [Ficus carica]
MGTTSPFKNHHHHHHHHHQHNPFHFLTKKLLPWTLYSLLPIALLRLYFYPLNFPLSSSDHLLPTTSPISIPFSISISISNPPPLIPPHQENKRDGDESVSCDYTTGKWVHDKQGPLYNGTTCGTIKEGQNCIGHGRPDLGYLDWRWEPSQSQCRIPRFDPNTFLQLISNKHIAFVGDSMARNQLESLLCMLATLSPPNLVYTNGEDNKFRRWNFPSHNANISVFWSPFLVHGVEKSSSGPNHNELYLDRIDERWAKDMDKMDLIVLSIGHWFLHPAVYFEGGSVLGCHYCPGLNHTEIGFYDVLRKALKTTLNTIKERRVRVANRKGISVVVTTFSPSHFEGEWDKAGACPKTRPYEEGGKLLEGMDADMRKIEVEEVELANKEENGERFLGYFRLEALDVTKLSLMRPDGHPGPYMHPFPFANGVIKKWDLGQSRREE